MKKAIIILTFLFIISVSAFAQFNFSTTPYKAPKGAVNLNKAGQTAKLKVGQVIYYQWTKTSNMDGFSIGVSGDGTEMLQRMETHIYTDKDKNKINTHQWKVVKTGKTKIEITDQNEKQNFINLEIQ